MTLSPQPEDGKSIIRKVDVRVDFDPGPVAAGRTLFELPFVSANVDTFATVIGPVLVSDARGAVPMTTHDRTQSAASVDVDTAGPRRDWITGRSTTGRLTATYTVPANAVRPARGPAPPVSFMADSAAFSGQSAIFLLHPKGDRSYRFVVRWNLSALPAGSVGVSSLGIGNVASSMPLTGDEMGSLFFMAGEVGVLPDSVPRSGFFGAWQGNPSFAAAPLLAWTRTLYRHYVSLFRPPDVSSYAVFLRYNSINAGGGVAMYRSFVATFGKGIGADVDHLKFTLAHEMFHTFQPHIPVPGGLETSWFSEGSAVLYQNRLPLRFGMVTSAAFLKDLNFFAGRYYTSIMASQPNGEIAKRFWADTRIRTLPYDRGMLYLAGVDAAIRKKSGGKRSLQDVLLEMLAAEQAGHANTLTDWEGALKRELGETAVADFRAFLAGRIPVPPSDAFGPCFRRTTAKLRRYEVGFDPAVLAEPRRIVRGLVAGSNAARSGLRDGDEIVVPVPQDGIQGEQTERLSLRIQRDGRTFDLSYLPRGEVVDAYQWERVPEVPESRCAL